jgi:hypothetical protein
MLSSDENELSVSLLLEFSGFKALFGGDSHTAVEQKIATVSQVQGVDLYKSNHHGSDTSSDAVSMSALQPSLVVIHIGCRVFVAVRLNPLCRDVQLHACSTEPQTSARVPIGRRTLKQVGMSQGG